MRKAFNKPEEPRRQPSGLSLAIEMQNRALEEEKVCFFVMSPSARTLMHDASVGFERERRNNCQERGGKGVATCGTTYSADRKRCAAEGRDTARGEGAPEGEAESPVGRNGKTYGRDIG